MPYKIFEFPCSETKNGALVMFQGNNVSKKAKNRLPFEIKRTLVIKGMKYGDIRGGHTHHKTRQILFCLSGSCRVELTDGKENDEVVLGNFNKGLLLEPYTWHVMKDFSEDAVLLVLADTEYDEKDYIRDYNEFLKFI